MPPNISQTDIVIVLVVVLVLGSSKGENEDEDDFSPQIGQIEEHQIRQKMGQHSALQATAQEDKTESGSRSECEQKPINTVHQAKQH